MRRHRRNLAIDLTSLLDVILILLFLVLMHHGKALDAAKNKQAKEQAKQASKIEKLEQRWQESERQNAALRESNEQLQKLSKLSKEDSQRYALWRQNTSVFDLYIEMPEQGTESSSASTNKTHTFFSPLIFKLQEEGKAPLVLAAEDWQQALSAAIQKTKTPFIMLTLHYDNEQIYWRDYQAIQQQILKLRAESQQRLLYNEEKILSKSKEKPHG